MTQPPPTIDPASKGQIDYINGLMARKHMAPEARAKAQAMLDEGISKELASRWITRLKSLPDGAETTLATLSVRVIYKDVETDSGTKRLGYLTGAGPVDIPKGHYAVETPGPEWTNDLTFFQLWIGDRGGWRLNVQASDDRYPVVAADKKAMVLALIAANPEAAMQRYGMELGKCGICNRTLTNDESRALGIGPVCRGAYR